MAKVFELMSGEYDCARVVLSGTVVAGAYVAIGTDTNGFYFEGGVSGDVVTVVTKAKKVKAAKTTGEAWVPGNALYYVSGTGKLTTTKSTNVLVGFCIEAAASADTFGYMAWDGSAAFLAVDLIE